MMLMLFVNFFIYSCHYSITNLDVQQCEVELMSPQQTATGRSLFQSQHERD